MFAGKLLVRMIQLAIAVLFFTLHSTGCSAAHSIRHLRETTTTCHSGVDHRAMMGRLSLCGTSLGFISSCRTPRCWSTDSSGKCALEPARRLVSLKRNQPRLIFCPRKFSLQRHSVSDRTACRKKREPFDCGETEPAILSDKEREHVALQLLSSLLSRTESEIFPDCVAREFCAPQPTSAVEEALDLIRHHVGSRVRTSGASDSYGLLPTDLLSNDKEQVPMSGHDHRCQLCSESRAHTVAHQPLRDHVLRLFQSICEQSEHSGSPIKLSQYDLNHGHLFAWGREPSLGMLFHIREYPRFNNDTFPFFLGFCQQGSDVTSPDPAARNLLWLEGKGSRHRLVMLNTAPSSCTYPLVFPGQECFGTIYEGDLGVRVADFICVDPASFDLHLTHHVRALEPDSSMSGRIDGQPKSNQVEPPSRIPGKRMQGRMLYVVPYPASFAGRTGGD